MRQLLFLLALLSTTFSFSQKEKAMAYVEKYKEIACITTGTEKMDHVT